VLLKSGQVDVFAFDLEAARRGLITLLAPTERLPRGSCT
jgi:hypothetical protein